MSDILNGSLYPFSVFLGFSNFHIIFIVWNERIVMFILFNQLNKQPSIIAMGRAKLHH